MRITPEGLRGFANSARHHLQIADVQPRNVLLRRLKSPKTTLPTSRRLLTVDTSPTRHQAVESASLETTSSGFWPAGNFTREVTKKEAQEDVQTHSLKSVKTLPQSCPGCGALSQEIESGEAGYYSRSRKAVKNYLKSLAKGDSEVGQSKVEPRDMEKPELLAIAEQATNDEHRNIDAGGQEAPQQSFPTAAVQIPVCDRCHDLIYQSRGVSIAHPPIDAIADSLAESPFRHNHVFHVLDAADFPMSLIPNIHRALSLAKPRSQNRRSQHDFSRKPTLSFVITRGDLLVRTKESIDRLLPYFTSVLRTALGSYAEDMRLGNVHLVSAKRGWWTKDIKETIWKRGGGNWMVGKANVGKSNLFEVLFPKGSGDRAPSYAELQQAVHQNIEDPFNVQDMDELPENSLLPPLQPETPFPVMPLVSSLPGTTASPIRLSFGNHRGELIDLPGLARGDLEDYVHPDHRGDLIMQTRPTVTQHNIKPGQSLLLGGGLVRITPLLDENDPSTIVMAYAFVPIDAHVTATTKATATQLQERDSGIKCILAEGAGAIMASAGMITLKDDVTKARAAPLLASGVSPSKLPFRVFATDVLIEGVGWVELVCQVRRRRQPARSVVAASPDGDAFQYTERTVMPTSEDNAFDLPQVEIFTPNGKHIGQRKSMQAWKMWQDVQGSARSKKSPGARPRKPMQGAKKRAKLS
jgi:hypothetical protein